jgi:creatinine amidohydrolase
MAPMDIVVRDLRIRHGMLASRRAGSGMGLPPDLFSPEEERFGIHAGRWKPPSCWRWRRST